MKTNKLAPITNNMDTAHANNIQKTNFLCIEVDQGKTKCKTQCPFCEKI